jgi:hypothetical protein
VPYLLGQYRQSTAAGKAVPLAGMSNKAVMPADIEHLPHDDYHPKTDLLNFAESEGAVHRGSLKEQWGFTLQHTPEYPNFDTRWKMMTVWMTANDVCGECKASSATDGMLVEWSSQMDQFLFNVTSTMKKV